MENFLNIDEALDLLVQRKTHVEAGIIINKGHKPTFSRRGGKTRGTLNITMNKGEGLSMFTRSRQKGDPTVLHNARITRPRRHQPY